MVLPTISCIVKNRTTVKLVTQQFSETLKKLSDKIAGESFKIHQEV